ncbi:TPA: SidE phosphodiesterase domain-containing protein [Legionella pneumophila]
MPKYVEGVELTQEGMHAIFARMGHPEIKSGTIYNGVPTIDQEALDKQGFMPVLTGVGPKRDSGHWIMLIKGAGNQYHLFDPMGKISGESYQDILATQLPKGSTLSVIPNEPGLNMGLCGYWVASVGLKARAELNKDNPPDLETLGRTTTEEMRNELTDNGYLKITGWLRAVSDKFPAGDPQPDAKTLRETTEKDLHIEIPSPVPPVKDTAPKEIPVKPTAPQQSSVPVWNGFSLFTDDTVRTAAKYAYDNYLGKPYTGPVESTPANIGGQMVYRQVHGLAHTLRTMAYAEIIVEEARKAKLRGETLGKFKDGRTIADVTPEELKKIMIAQAFFVTGRDDEESAKNYAKYHEQSRDAFLKYVKENESTLIPDVFKDQEEVNFYARVIEDKNHDWDSTPAHVLINQGHMVDLVRVKQPPESFLQRYFSSMQRWIGTQATEAVFSIQRQFFHATYEAVTGFDSDNKEPHLVVSGLGRYVIGEDGKPIREAPKQGEKEGELKVFSQTYKLKENERFMRVDEFLKLPEIQSTFPGSGKHLEGGMPGMNYMDYWDRLNSRERARCENDVDFCLKQLQTAHDKAKIDPLKEAFQSSKEKGKRQPNMDEIAAARIIQQIMANPDCIGNDHVSINGQELGEKFFRDLLAKCDMAVVGSLLNDTDIKNIDTLMRHEKDTEFHSTDPQAVPVKIGDAWENKIRTKGGDVTQMKHDLIFLMQNDAWYFSRVNAIAQNRDKGSSFKEVLFTALMTPLTNKSLMDTSHVPAPKKVYRGLNLPEEFKNKLINQANVMIANTTERLFTDHSSEAFKQIKLNDFSQMSGRTCASTTTTYELTKAWDSNVVFEMLDPDGLLHPKQVGTHMAGSEDEFSIYLPEDVALVPVKVTFDGKTTNGEDRCVFTLVAVKSPDFIPRHESGYAVEPFMKMQKEKVTQALDAIEKDKGSYNIDEQLKNLRIEMVRQAKLPLREGIFDRLSHRLSLETSDNKISPERRDFLNQHVIPVLQECHIALRTNNMEMMQNALAKFPTDKQWSAFKSGEAVRAKAQMDVLKQQIEKKIMLQTQIIPALTECGEALDKQNATEALQALNKLPAEKEIGKVKTIGQELRGQIVGVKQELTGNLEPLQRAVTTPVVKDAEKMRVRYETLVTDVTKRVTDFEKIKPANLENYNKAIADLNNIQQELTLLRNEKIRMHTDKDKAVDFSDIEALEKRLQETQPKLLTQLLEQTSKDVAKLVKIPEKLTFTIIKSMKSKIKEQMDILELARNERIKQHGTSTEPLDMSDLDKLKGELQTLNQNLVDDLLEDIKDSLSNIKDIATFEEESKYIEKCLDHLTGLEQTLDGSEKAIKQKEDISTYRKALIDKQEKAYPEMIQLQYKSEGLIMQLRDLCNAHHENVAETTKARLQQLENKNSEGGLLGGLWTVTNTLGLTTDTVHVEKMQIRMKEQVLRGFKTGLNNDKQNVDQIIGFLAKKKPSELEEGLGISKENATELYGLLQQLDSKTASIDKLQENAKLIDEISTKIGREPIKHDHVITMVEEENDDMRYGF